MRNGRLDGGIPGEGVSIQSCVKLFGEAGFSPSFGSAKTVASCPGSMALCSTAVRPV
jgi:hypothetical protein